MKLSIVILLAISGILHSQETSLRYRFGAAWNSTWHVGTLQAYDPTAECGSYANGKGGGGSGFGGIDIPAGFDWKFGAVIEAATGGATFVTRKSDLLVRDANFALVPFIRDYTLTTALTRVALAVSAAWQPLPIPLSLRLGVGPEYRFVTQGSQSGVVASPSGVTFTDGTRTHSLGTAALPGLRPWGGIASAALSYELPMGGAMRLVPEVRATMSFPSLTTTGTWRPYALTFGVTIAGALTSHDAIEEERNPVVITTIIRTSPGMYSTSESQQPRLTLTAGILATGHLLPPAITLHRVNATLERITSGNERTVDTTIEILNPQTIAFTIYGTDQLHATNVHVGIINGEDTAFAAPAQRADPALVLWADSAIAGSMLTGHEEVRAVALASDSTGMPIHSDEIKIPISVDSSPTLARLHRYVADASYLKNNESAFVERLLSDVHDHATLDVFISRESLPLAEHLAKALRERGVAADVHHVFPTIRDASNTVIVDARDRNRK